MIVDIAPRQAGKTTRMISWLLGNRDRIVITYSENEKVRLQEIVTDLKSPEARDQIMTWAEAQRHRGFLSCREVSIDIEISKAQYLLDGYEFNVWIFRQRVARETEGYRFSNDKVGFFFSSIFGYTGRVISFRIPYIRGKFF